MGYDRAMDAVREGGNQIGLSEWWVNTERVGFEQGPEGFTDEKGAGPAMLGVCGVALGPPH